LHDEKKLGIETNMKVRYAKSRELTNKKITTSYSKWLLVTVPMKMPLEWTRKCEGVKRVPRY
jgi:hypothetical protein